MNRVLIGSGRGVGLSLFLGILAELGHCVIAVHAGRCSAAGTTVSRAACAKDRDHCRISVCVKCNGYPVTHCNVGKFRFLCLCLRGVSVIRRIAIRRGAAVIRRISVRRGSARSAVLFYDHCVRGHLNLCFCCILRALCCFLSVTRCLLPAGLNRYGIISDCRYFPDQRFTLCF